MVNEHCVSKEEIELITNILNVAAAEIRDIDNESGEIFIRDGANVLEEKLKQKVLVVIDLAEMLRAVTKEKFILKRVNKFYSQAKKCIASNDFRDLCQLLESDENESEKNDLEILIEEYEKHKN